MTQGTTPSQGAGRLRVLRGPGAPRWNMAVDEALLSEAEDLVLRLYSWQPFAVSLGFFQRPEPELIREWSDEGIGCVRRLTGGGAILHAHELTYSLAGPETMEPFRGGVEPSYRFVHDCLIETFRAFGVEVGYADSAPRALSHGEQPFLCFARSTALDLCAQGRKIVGSAKRRRDGRALQHGSILLAPHPRQQGAITLQELLGGHPDREAFEDAVVTTIAGALQREPYEGTLSPAEHARALEIQSRAPKD